MGFTGFSVADDGGDGRTDPGDIFHFDSYGVRSYSHTHDGITTNASAEDTPTCTIPVSTTFEMCAHDMRLPIGWEASGLWLVKLQPYDIPNGTAIDHTLTFRIAKWYGTSLLECLPGTEYEWMLDYDHHQISPTCAIG